MNEFMQIKSSRYQPGVLDRSETAMIERFLKEPSLSNRSISFELDRSPDIWKAFSVEGRHNDVLVVFDTLKNKIAGAMVCSQKSVFVYGEKIQLGYVSSLKVGVEYQGSIVIGLLFKYFKKYCQSQEAFVWLFSVFSDNDKALAFFDNKNRILPVFKPIEESFTYIFKMRVLSISSGFQTKMKIRTANKADLNSIIDFIKAEVQVRAFVPDYSQNEIGIGEGLLNGFNLDDLLISENENGICGLMALWNQYRIRRWKVGQYSKIINALRPIINFGSFMLGIPTLPKVGNSVEYKVLSLVLIRNNNEDVFRLLFNRLMKSEKSDNRLYSVSLLKNNPLNRYFKKRAVIMKNKIYIGYWPEDELLVNKLNLKNLYLEQGAL